jgi:hypothetical protein
VAEISVYGAVSVRVSKDEPVPEITIALTRLALVKLGILAATFDEQWELDGIELRELRERLELHVRTLVP